MSATPYARSASEANLTRRQDRQELQEAVAATRFCAPHIFQAIIRLSHGGASARLQEPRRWQRWTAMSGITTCAEIAIVQVLTLFKLDARVVPRDRPRLLPYQGTHDARPALAPCMVQPFHHAPAPWCILALMHRSAPCTLVHPSCDAPAPN